MLVPTVLILGAGASRSYGLPIGTELVDLVTKEIPAVAGLPGTYGEIMKSSDTGRAQLRYHSKQYVERIQNSRAPTIDEFLRDAPDIREIVVRALVRVLWKREYEALTRGEAASDDWIAWLFHRALLRRPEEFADNALVVLSFNYDRLPQFLLTTMMANGLNRPVTECAASVGSQCVTDQGTLFDRFQHVHGAILAESRENHDQKVVASKYFDSGLIKAASKISTMWDEQSGPDGPGKGQSYYDVLWDWAHRVILLGFGYHESNLNRIGLTADRVKKMTAERKVVAGTGYKLGQFARSQLEALTDAGFELGDEQTKCQPFLEMQMARLPGVRPE